MAAGLPVLATRVGGNPEAVRDEIDGILVPPGNVAAFAEGLNRLLADPELRRRMGDSAVHRARSTFDRESMLNQMAELLTEAMATCRR